MRSVTSTNDSCDLLSCRRATANILISLKISGSPKLTLLHNFGFSYHSINLRKSFRLKKIHKKCYTCGKLFREDNFAILIILISHWQLLSSRCQIRRGYVTAKHMYVCVSQNTHDSSSWKLSKLSSCKIYECIRKRKKIVSLFFVKAKTKEREESICLWISNSPRFERQDE